MEASYTRLKLLLVPVQSTAFPLFLLLQYLPKEIKTHNSEHLRTLLCVKPDVTSVAAFLMNCLAEESQMAGTVSTHTKSPTENAFPFVLMLIVLSAASLRNLRDSEKTFSAFIDFPLAALISRLLLRS